MRVAVVGYLCLWLMCLVAAVVLWTVARATGVMKSIEHLVGQLTSSPNFHFDGLKIVVLSTAVAVVLALVGAAASGVAAALLNLAGDVVGGVEIAVQDRPPLLRRRGRGPSERGRAAGGPGPPGPVGGNAARPVTGAGSSPAQRASRS